MKALLITTQLAGIALLVATMVLLFFRRIYLDATTKLPIKVTLPILGEISTQAPVLILVFVGASMVVYPLSMMTADVVELEGHIDTGGKSVSVVVVAVPQYTMNQDAPGQFAIKIPLLAADAKYRVKFLVDKQVIDEQPVKLQDGRFVFQPVTWSPPSDETKIPIKKEVSDEDLRKWGIHNQ